MRPECWAHVRDYMVSAWRGQCTPTSKSTTKPTRMYCTPNVSNNARSRLGFSPFSIRFSCLIHSLKPEMKSAQWKHKLNLTNEHRYYLLIKKKQAWNLFTNIKNDIYSLKTEIKFTLSSKSTKDHHSDHSPPDRFSIFLQIPCFVHFQSHSAFNALCPPSMPCVHHQCPISTINAPSTTNAPSTINALYCSL